MHGKEFFDHYQGMGISLCYTSESAIESRNRATKQARLTHARKTSRLDNISDTFRWLLASSDPFYSENRRLAKSVRRRGKKSAKLDKRKRRPLF